jgi:hypothetical protein
MRTQHIASDIKRTIYFDGLSNFAFLSEMGYLQLISSAVWWLIDDGI